jgi:ferric-dicitrate binding protein FerR (iron transport regulator)
MASNFMQGKNIDEIIRLVLTSEATREEANILAQWLAASDENRQVFEHMQQIWEERDPEPSLPNAEQLSNQIWAKALQADATPRNIYKTSTPSPITYYTRVAAVMLLVIGLPLLLFFYSATSVQEPGKTQIVFTEKKSAIGQKLKITLPDGSLAWLNADSKIQYAANFEGNTRTILLEGEGYFEVKKNANKPFIVKSGNVSTTALGTSFNIQAYPEDSTIQVALLTGKVQVKSPQAGTAGIAFSLREGNGIHYNKKINQSSKYTVDQDQVMAWKQGILLFDGDSFEEVTSRIRRWYGVEITISGTPPNDWKLTGKFKNETLTSVLENIRFGRNFSYQISGKQLNFHFNTPKR